MDRLFDLLEHKYAKKITEGLFQGRGTRGSKNKVSGNKGKRYMSPIVFFLMWFLTQLYVYMHQYKLLYCTSL